MKILQIVGFKNTGKTTLIVEFLKLLKTKGVTVGVIKHHHVDLMEDTDTGVFSRYSDITLMNTPNFSLWHHRQPPNLETQIKTLENKVEVILIEGYKYADYDKIVLTDSLSNQTDNIRELDLTNVIKYCNIKTDLKALLEWFKEWSTL